MFWNREVIYKGSSKKRYDEIINILTINNIKYDYKIENKNSSKGPLIDKMMIGSLQKSEDFSFEYIIYIDKKDYGLAEYLISK